MNSDKRNLNPTKEAIVAMCVWGKEYSQQRGGAMDFWDNLTDGAKDTCRDIVSRINNAPSETDQ